MLMERKEGKEGREGGEVEVVFVWSEGKGGGRGRGRGGGRGRRRGKWVSKAGWGRSWLVLAGRRNVVRSVFRPLWLMNEWMDGWMSDLVLIHINRVRWCGIDPSVVNT